MGRGMRERRGISGRRTRTAPPWILVMTAVAAGPGAARADPGSPQMTVIEVALSVRVPATVSAPSVEPDRYGNKEVLYGDLLEAGGGPSLSLAHLFSVGASPARWWIGPELSLAYMISGPEVGGGYSDPYGPPSDDWSDLVGVRLHFLAALRAHREFDWGYLLFRAGAGPEFAALEQGDWRRDGDVGALVAGGFGIAFRVADWFAFTIFGALLGTFHEEDDTSRDSYTGELQSQFYTYRSLEADISIAATFLL